VSVSVGDLVIITQERELGVGRVERFLDDGRVRIWLYASGTFIVRARDQVAPCPPNTPVVHKP
jgi:hypothetical protein